MENASKALYMAAAILISIMLVGIFVYIFRAGARTGEKYEQKQAEEQLQLFNSKFEYYNKKNNTISDMITVANLAIDTNEKISYNSQKTVAIDICFGGTSYLSISNKYGIERNFLYYGESNTINGNNKKMYMYDLMNKKMEDLKLYKNDTTFGAGDFSISLGADGKESLSLVNKDQVYKYYFNIEEIKYQEQTGRVNYMKFKLILNPDFEAD